MHFLCTFRSLSQPIIILSRFKYLISHRIKKLKHLVLWCNLVSPIWDSIHRRKCYSHFVEHLRDLKIRRRRRRWEHQKSNRFSNQNNSLARASPFFVHYFAVTAALRRENAQFYVVQRAYTSDDEISSLYLNLDMVLRNSTLGGFTYIWES